MSEQHESECPLKLDKRLATLETLLAGTRYQKGFVQEVRDEMEDIRQQQEKTRRLTNEYHHENTERMDKLINRLKLLGVAILSFVIAAGVFSGWKLSAIETLLKTATIVAK